MMRRTTAIIAVLMLTRIAAFAGEGTSAATFLEVESLARIAGMGGATAALSGDIYCLSSNPAGIGNLTGPELLVAHHGWINYTQNGTVNYAFPLKGYRALGVGLSYFSAGTMTGRDLLGNETGGFSGSDAVGTVGYAWPLNPVIEAGLAAKVVHEAVYDRSATAFALDAGLLYHKKRFHAAAVVRNAGTPLKLYQTPYPLPLTAEIGARYLVMKDASITADAALSRTGSFSFQAGGEWFINKTVFLRGGYASGRSVNTGPGISAGFGILFKGYQFDYALVPFGDFGLSHLVTLKINFADAAKKRPFQQRQAGRFKKRPHLK